MTAPSKAVPLASSLFLGLALCSSSFAKDDAARLAALKARVEAIAEETACVEAITKIQRLGRAFGYYTDKGYFGEAADLFTDGGTFQWSIDGVYKGKARIQELLTRHGGGSMKEGPGLPFGRLNLRMQLQPVVTVAADGESAHARWREWGLLGQYKKEAIWGDAIIEDDYVKENGVWKFKKLHGPFNMYAGYKEGWLDHVTVNTYPEKFPPWPDLPPSVIYLTYPSYYVEPFHYPNPVTGKPMPAPSPRAGGEAFGR